MARPHRRVPGSPILLPGKGPGAGLTALAIGLLGLAIGHASVRAQTVEKGWETNAFIGILNDEPEFNPDESETGDQFRRDAIFGLRVGYVTRPGAFLQAEAANSLLRFDLGGQDVNLNSFWLGGVFGWNIGLGRDVELFPALGAGLVVWDPDGHEGQTEFTFNYGLGGRHFLNPRLAIRADARMRQVAEALLESRRRAGPVGDAAADLFALELSVGVAYFFPDRSETPEAER